MNKTISIYWLIPLVIFSGIFGFLTNSYSFFKFKNEIDLLNLIGIIITASIGIYIASSLQKSIEAKKFEKELVIEVFRSLTNKTKFLDKYLSANSLKFKQTVRSFKDISSLISELKELNEICNIVEVDKITELRSCLMEIKPLITGSSVEDEYFKLTLDHKGLSTKKLKDFRKRIISLMMDVNRS